MTTPLPPAGWFPDPSDPGRQRWWDGTRWTEFSTDRQSSGSAPQTPVALAPSAIAPGRRFVWRPTLSTWIVGAIALLCGIVGIGSNGLGGFLVGVSVFALGAGIWTLVTRRPSWLNLSGSRRAGGAALGISFAVVLLGALIAPQPSPDGSAVNVASQIEPSSTSSAVSPQPKKSATSAPSPTSKPTTTPSPVPKPKPTPLRTVQVVDVPESIAYQQSSYDEPTIDVGTTVVVTAGVPGTKVLRWEITLVDGVEVSRALVSESVTVAPVDEVTAVGSRQPAPPPPAEPAPQEAGCDPNYEWGCVPIASDVDCPGGSGNGPAYAPGTVHVIGTDVYDLDRDGDGVACD
jgi:hypothetical protein